MNNWNNATLGGVVKNVSRRFDFSDKEKVVFVNTGDVLDGKFLHKNYQKGDGLPGQAKKAIKRGDILLSEIRPANKRFALVDFDADDYVVSTKFMVVRGNEKIDPKYLYLLLTSNHTLKEFQIIAESRSGTFPQITFDSIANFPILLPTLSEQKEIVATLSSMDDKIELLRKQNETLEKIAQTIFKEWFVDFTIDGKKLKLKNSIPEDWRVGKLTDIADFLNGYAMQKFPPESQIEFLPVIKIKEMNSGITNQTDKASVNIPEKYIVNNGDILFSWSGSLDIDIWKYGKGALNQHLFKVTSEKYPKWFYFYWIKFHLPNFRQIATAKAVTMGHIQRHHLDDAKVFVPDDKHLKMADNLIYPIFEKTILNNSEIQSLSHLRDTLLLKLMSGELKINF